MITADLHSQPQKSHRSVVGLLGRNRTSGGGAIGTPELSLTGLYPPGGNYHFTPVFCQSVVSHQSNCPFSYRRQVGHSMALPHNFRHYWTKALFTLLLGRIVPQSYNRRRNVLFKTHELFNSKLLVNLTIAGKARGTFSYEANALNHRTLTARSSDIKTFSSILFSAKRSSAEGFIAPSRAAAARAIGYRARAPPAVDVRAPRRRHDRGHTRTRILVIYVFG
ncbi:hypothetical protein EVAR_32971_1 [Eumeta japonica]|uniref:Uncharacterized protein n=1 Tax=Eumeta variegata TaxID=151549 RepID=A0A4C1X060_EUMVA|nr:hypothetical protein EVAR_32971_1 [Eumeta japonica]